MRIIKLGLISFVFIFLVVTAISALLPSKIIISRAVDISAPRDSVYLQIADLNNWRRWYEGFDSLKTSVAGNTLTIGKSTVTVTSSGQDKVDMLWQMKGRELMKGEFNFIGEDSASHLTVQWQFVHVVRWYPWEKFGSIAANKTIGDFMEKSLDNLKKEVE